VAGSTSAAATRPSLAESSPPLLTVDSLHRLLDVSLGQHPDGQRRQRGSHGTEDGRVGAAVGRAGQQAASSSSQSACVVWRGQVTTRRAE
jgi:hypothetical protein